MDHGLSYGLLWQDGKRSQSSSLDMPGAVVNDHHRLTGHVCKQSKLQHREPKTQKGTEYKKTQKTKLRTHAFSSFIAASEKLGQRTQLQCHEKAHFLLKISCCKDRQERAKFVLTYCNKMSHCKCPKCPSCLTSELSLCCHVFVRLGCV